MSISGATKAFANRTETECSNQQRGFFNHDNLPEFDAEVVMCRQSAV
jgi:hypothetical protein